MPLSSFKNRCSLAVVILLLFCVSSFPRASYPQEQGKTEDKGKKVLKKIGKKLEEDRLLTLLAAGFAFFGAKRTLDVYKQKEKGDSILPIFKIDADYQKLTQDIQGYHLGGELGIAFNGERVLYDLQAALRYKVRYLGARAGYRFIRASTQDWHGPQAGLFLEW